MRLSWARFVDIITVIWLIFFILSFFDLGATLNLIIEYTTLSFLVIFILDIIILYRNSESTKHFFKKHWFDVLMVIPFFRVLRIFRVFRLLRVTKGIKSRVKLGEKTSKAIKKTKRISKRVKKE